NYPNPFNPATTISFTVPEKAHATLSIFNIEGKLVKTLVNNTLEEGYKQTTWDGTDSHGNAVSSGVYFYRLRAGGKALTRKMVVIH
ncbi:MAG: T9SS type A sorting domain-containing protein, partial [Thermoplasmata archaeon]|nr:T9SS type A sorting domain-containing protein [Thermoplasmata archaeon]